MSDFEEKYDYQEIMVEDISQIYQIANDYNSFYDLPRSGRGDPGDERTYLQAFYRGQSDSSWKITPSICRDTSVDESILESGDLLFEVMAYNQHYIHATRLIDFTMDINVALFLLVVKILKKMRLYLYGLILRMILNGQGQRYSVNLLMLKSNV